MILKGLHWAAGQAMRKAGYHWEVRRGGELKLGFWRKSWRARSPSGASPRRLVLIPGFGDTPLSWIGILTLLRPAIHRHFDEIVLVDFPGFAGFLSHEPAFHSMELLKNTLFDALDSLCPQTVLGHSLGGWLATLYAVECGEKLRPKTQAIGPGARWAGPEQIILVSPSGVFADEQTAIELRTRFEQATQAKERGIEIMRPHIFGKEPIWFRWVHRHFSAFFESEEVARFVASIESAHLISEERLSHVQSRVWLVWGEMDTLIPPTAIPVFLRKLNEGRIGCRALVLKNCGHTPQIEAPAALALALSNIFTETAGKKPRFFGFPASHHFYKLIEEC